MGKGLGKDNRIELMDSDLVEGIGHSGETVGLSDNNLQARSERLSKESGSRT
jgi:hypothetical protein